MKAYYARPITHYDTEEDNKTIKLLKKMGLDVVDPNSKENTIAYKERGMDVFFDIIDSCDLVFYKTFWEGFMTAGVKKELDHAKENRIPIFEITQMIRHKVLSVEETRNAIKRGVK